MAKKLKKYTARKMAKIALAALKGELTYAQIRAKYGVHSTQINRWKQKLKLGMVERYSRTISRLSGEKMMSWWMI